LRRHGRAKGPAIHAFAGTASVIPLKAQGFLGVFAEGDVDGRDKPGHDEVEERNARTSTGQPWDKPGHDGSTGAQ
jgi:hypothetical protein